MADLQSTCNLKRIAKEVLAVLKSKDREKKPVERKAALEEPILKKRFSRYINELFFRNWLFKRQPQAELAAHPSLPVPFEKVLEDELSEIRGLREGRLGAKCHGFERAELVGLALSGGGIRSATFNLGVLQELAGQGLLNKFDYLSTVSGGGYIGSWLLAWLKRKSFEDVCEQLKPDWCDRGGEKPPEIEFLRSYSNYLTPQLGLLSADTWTMVATWVRNLVLNLTILILAVSAVLLLPRLIVDLSHCDRSKYYLLLAAGLMLFAIIWTGINLKLVGLHYIKFPRYSEQWAVQCTIVIPTVLASWLGSCWLWSEGRAGCESWLSWWSWWEWMLLGALATLVVWTMAWIVSLFMSLVTSLRDRACNHQDSCQAKPAKGLAWFPIVFFSSLEGAAGGLLLFELYRLFAHMNTAGYPGNNVHFVAVGTGLVAGIFGLMAVVQIGLMGKRFSDERREWWSRTSAWVSIYCLAWTSVFAIALYSPLVIQWASYKLTWTVVLGILGWLAETTIGVVGARSPKTGGNGPVNNTGLVVKAAPYVFVVGLCAVLSFAIYLKLPHEVAQKPAAIHIDFSWKSDSGGKSAIVATSLKKDISFHDLASAYWSSSVWCSAKDPAPFGCATNKNPGPISPWRILVIIIVAGGIAVLLSCRVDINEFSMHLLYRNRLVRCYLGASHQNEGRAGTKPSGGAAIDDRNPNPFTGFDPNDDILLVNLSQKPPPEASRGKEMEQPFVGPYPILNATLNVTHGKRLAWQERKAESFVFTPRYCGFDVKPDRQPRIKGKRPPEGAGFRPTVDFLYSQEERCPFGPFLGTAMGISGAAVCPNMGYHTSSSLAFLMTVFDVRTGWWAGNTRHRTTWKRRGPKLGIFYLLMELFGATDDERGYVYLSDGGHFENLGIYELVRRHCRLIIASDSSQDGNYQLEDLGNAIRKCRDDFGIDIEIDARNLHPLGEAKLCKSHCAVGLIRYDKVWPKAKPGILIYVKASITGDEPTDVLEYRSKHGDFPHDSTANQWFSESQFESYRKLGQHVIEQCSSRYSKFQQTMTVLDLVEMDSWTQEETSGLTSFLARNLGGFYQSQT